MSPELQAEMAEIRQAALDCLPADGTWRPYPLHALHDLALAQYARRRPDLVIEETHPTANGPCRGYRRVVL
jgi:hypothetical protein